MQELLKSLGTGGWTTVCDSWHDDNSNNGGLYSAFAPPSAREAALRTDSWDIRVDDFRPGFSQTYRDGQTVTTYEPSGVYEEFEPLVLAREYHGVVPSALEIVEQFRLYHNLYWNELTGQFLKPHDDGTSETAIKIDGKKVEVKTSLLCQYQAARQLDLYFYIDSVRYGAPGTALPESQQWSSGKVRATLDVSEGYDGRPFTRFIGKRVLDPPPMEKAGIWPYEEKDDHFPDFIIGVDADGPVLHTCNPDALSDYFGGNPGEPHYLTPVHFRRDVLQKYYDQPEIYTVSDGYLRHAALWGLRLDNNSDQSVVVFLGDLGRDLPRQERDYWRSFNIEPEGSLSETLIRRAYLGQFADPTADDLRVRSSYVSLSKGWREHFGWELFRTPEEADAGLLQRLRLPLNESQAEVESSVRIMTQLFVDALNESVIKGLLPDRRENEGGISKVERWLTQEGYPHVARDIKFLRNLQEIRSKMTAHRKGSDYEKTLTKVFGELRGPAAIKKFFESALEMLKGLDEWIASRATPEPDAASDQA